MVKIDPTEWGSADVQHPDFSGVAQLDHKLTGSDSLASLTGLNDDEWQIVGFNIGGGESHWDLYVAAVPVSALPDGGDVIHQYADAHGGEIRARLFLVHHVDPFEVLRSITHEFELSMHTRGAEGVRIVVDELDDLGLRDDEK